MTTSAAEVANYLLAHRALWSEKVVAAHYQQEPGLHEKYGDHGRQKYLQDVNYHFRYLSEAVAVESPTLFLDYVAWAKTLLHGLGMPGAELVTNLRNMRDLLSNEVPSGMVAIPLDYLSQAIEAIPQMPDAPPSYIDDGNHYSAIAHSYLNVLVNGDRHQALRIIMDAVDSGVPVKDIYIHVFQTSQYEIGRLWQLNKLSVPQERYCTAATQLIMSQLYPYIFSGEKKDHTVVAMSISNELHEIGIRMVADFFEMEGWDSYYLGANTPTSSLLEMLKTQDVDVLAISATMSYHVDEVARLISVVRKELTQKPVKIMVGGYSFKVEPRLWQMIHADGYAQDAREAVACAEQLIGR